MSSLRKIGRILLATLVLLSSQTLQGQDKLSWLDDYTGDIHIGSESYRYNFNNVEGDDCKLKFEEIHTHKKGNKTARSWIFYLSDMDPSAMSFKAKGKSIDVVLETYRSQKFISYYEGEELDGFTEKIVLTMNEVNMARSFIGTLNEKLSSCQETQVVWETRNQAFNWLMDNVGEAMDDGTEWRQEFKKGKQDYLVEFEAKSVDSKGEQLSSISIFDLSDIDPMAIDLRISGKSLMVELTVKENKKYIEVKSPEGSQFTPKLLIYTNEIEVARQVVNALYYLVNNTIPERPTWESYSSSLEFVKDNMGELTVDDDLYSNSLNFEPSPSGLVNLATVKTESDGTSERVEYAFYLTDIMEQLELEVSRNSITLGIVTKEKHDYIREMKDEKVSDYTSTLNFHAADIDGARDILNAFEFAIGASEEKIKEFKNISETETWFSENIGQIEIGEEVYTQNLTILKEFENQMIVESNLTKADGESTESRFILYPEDISLDKLDISVSGKKLYVLLQTEKGKYVKEIENGNLQNFTSSSEVLFYDPLLAKNFMAAIRFLQENSVVEDRAAMQKEAAMAFIRENIQNIAISDEKYEQKMEVVDEEGCTMSFTRVETDSKGGGRNYSYEFTVSDIDPDNSEFTIKGALVIINLVTRGGEKLIKPYKDEEAGDFVNDFIIYADDVLLAKQMLAAFAALSEECSGN
jgi:hypothetical protein